MFKKALIFTLFTFFTANSQKLVSEINIDIPKKSEAFQFEDNDTKNVFLFLDNKEIISSFKLDENLKVVDSIKINKGEDKIESIIGYSKKDSTYFTYWNSNDKKQFYILSYNFDKKESNVSPINFDIGKEKIINRMTIKNKFYIITVTKKTNDINFYCFTDKTYTKNTIDLSEHVFYNYDNSKALFYDLCNDNSPIQYISDENPASLTFASKESKSYIDGNSIIFTFDNNKDYTQLLKINLDTYQPEYKIFSQPFFAKIDNSVDTNVSNSFFTNNKLIQFKTNFSIFSISVKDFNKNEIKSMKIMLDKEIEFKNSDILQEKLSIKNTRVLDKTNQLLRKMSNSNPAISCYFDNDMYYFTLGSVSEIQNNNAMYGGMFGAAGVLLSMALTSNYTVSNIHSYNNRIVVYINCLFDKNFKHIEGEKKQLAFDKLRTFIANSKFDNNVAFKMDNNLIFGGSNTNKKYFFYTFSNN